MTIVEALASIENDGIRLGAGDFVDVEALKVAADVLRKAIEGNPVIPGHDDQYNIAEMSYNNGYAKGCEDSKQKWIPVSERLPDTFGTFIVAVRIPTRKRTYSDCADFDPFTKKWTPSLFWGKGMNVTHWMPLPEPPKEDTVKP